MSEVDKVTLKDVYDVADQLSTKLDDMRKDIASNYVTKDAFEPVRNLVYGLVALILVAVVGSVIALVIHETQPQQTTPTTTVKVSPTN